MRTTFSERARQQIAAVLAANNPNGLICNIVKCRFGEQMLAVEAGVRADVDCNTGGPQGSGRRRSDGRYVSGGVRQAVAYGVTADKYGDVRRLKSGDLSLYSR